MGCALLVLVMFELLPARVTAWAGSSSSTDLRPLAFSPTARHRRPLPAAGRPGACRRAHRAGDLLPDVPPSAALQHRRLRNRGHTRGRDQDHEPVDQRPENPGDPGRRRRRYVLVHDDIYRAQGEEPPVAAEGFRLIRTFPGVRVLGLRRTCSRSTSTPCSSSGREDLPGAPRALPSIRNAPNLANIDALPF